MNVSWSRTQWCCKHTWYIEVSSQNSNWRKTVKGVIWEYIVNVKKVNISDNGELESDWTKLFTITLPCGVVEIWGPLLTRLVKKKTREHVLELCIHFFQDWYAGKEQTKVLGGCNRSLSRGGVFLQDWRLVERWHLFTGLVKLEWTI